MVDEINEQSQELEAFLEVKQKELAQTEKGIEKMLDLYEEGMITKQRFSERIGVHEKTKSELEAEVEKCKLALAAQE